MKTTYKRLDQYSRFEIEKLIALGKNQKQIATHLGVSPSTISREINRLENKPYSARFALADAVSKSLNKRDGISKINSNDRLKNFIYVHLKKRWSPKKISRALRLFYPEYEEMQISHETIYAHIYVHPKNEVKKLLISQLTQKRNYRGNTRRGADKRTNIPDPVRIDQRPPEVESREVPGHWEGDLILGKNRESAIGTLVERTSRFLIIVKLKAKDATSVRKAFEKAFKNIPKHLKLSLTYDNGSEMTQHKLLTKNTKIDVYFTNPYSPWERGTNENTNGLIRGFLPKGTDFNLVSKKELEKIQLLINQRPRNVLNDDTPINVLHKLFINQNIV